MELGQQLNQSQKQSLKLTQQMEQSIKILQMDMGELWNYVEEMALENPAIDLDALQESRAPEVVRQKKLEWLEQQARNDRQNMAYYDRGREYHLERTVAADDRQTLEQHLLAQISLKDKALERGVAYLAGCLDKDGYLCAEVDQLAEEGGYTPQLLKEALAELKKLDPPGVGAATLAECLLLQLPEEDSSARAIIEAHLEEMAKNKPDKVAKTLGLSRQEVAEDFERIRTLNPRPGSAFDHGEPSQYINPDVVVVGFEDHYMVLPCDFGFPTVAISTYARELMTQANGETGEYISKKVKEVESLCKSIAGRSETVLAVAKEIVRHQEDFFRLGPGYLDVLRMGDIAAATGLHESTISRAAKNKYLQCTHGIYPLRYFFVQEAGAGAGGASSDTVKHRIRALVEGENKQRPLSDQKIAEVLKGEGMAISRRTVAKYRDQMGIPGSSVRATGN